MRGVGKIRRHQSLEGRNRHYDQLGGHRPLPGSSLHALAVKRSSRSFPGLSHHMALQEFPAAQNSAVLTLDSVGGNRVCTRCTVRGLPPKKISESQQVMITTHHGPSRSVPGDSDPASNPDQQTYAPRMNPMFPFLRCNPAGEQKSFLETWHSPRTRPTR